MGLWIGLAGVAPLGAAVERARIASGRAALLVDKRDLFLEAAPEPGDGWQTFARRWTGSASQEEAISKANRNARRPLAGVRYRIPFRLLQDDAKLAVVRALFPKDRSSLEGWMHRTRGETVEVIADWFTGGRAAASRIREQHGLSASGGVAAGSNITIPNDLLQGIFRYVAPVLAPSPPTVVVTPSAGESSGAGRVGSPAIVAPASPEASTGTLLDYDEDAEGKIAVYRLRPGEALYSAVVIRFTGRLEADDVNSLAADVARRSAISDVTDIPIGYPVKIPFDILLPEFLPEGDPRRLEYEVEQRLAAQYKNVVEARGLEGVTVVLDAGHGGVDVGASMAGVWESLYVYDIALRVKRRLESDSKAEVRLTTRDGAGWQIHDRDVLPYSRGHAVLTTPPFPITDAIIGVNLRWYLANSLLKQAKGEGGSAEKVVFLSIHADSLHPTIRGATIYVPDSTGSEAPFRKSGAAFTARKEVRDQPTVSFSAKERQRSEGLSRDLAEDVIAALRERELAIHPFKPVRDKIYRGRRAWVPAVLRYNAIPAKLLLEVCNLANSDDRKLLNTRAFRERMAEAVVDGIRSYFKEQV